jgi:hypothetical protein
MRKRLDLLVDWVCVATDKPACLHMALIALPIPRAPAPRARLIKINDKKKKD